MADLDVRYSPQPGGAALFTSPLVIASYPNPDTLSRDDWEEAVRAVYEAAKQVAGQVGGLAEVQYAGWNSPDWCIPTLLFLFDLGDVVAAGDQFAYFDYNQGRLGEYEAVREFRERGATVQNTDFAHYVNKEG